jgi:hypothetical protein
VADFLSRHYLAAVRTAQVFFRDLTGRLSCQLSVDRFADPGNNVLPRYNTYYPSEYGAPIDAFAQGDWGVEGNYCHPPVALLNRLVSFLRGLPCPAVTVVLAPYWPA